MNHNIYAYFKATRAINKAKYCRREKTIYSCWLAAKSRRMANVYVFP